MAAAKSGQSFALILMDLRMPVLDGFAATRRLREQGYRGVIIAHSGDWTDEVREACLRAGCDGYVNKLLGWQETFKVLSGHLESRHVAGTAAPSAAAGCVDQTVKGA